MFKCVFVLISLFLFNHATATTYWAAPGGTDANAGTIGQPFSIAKAFATAAAGDVVWVKGGIYKISATLKFTNAGTSLNYIKIWAVVGEQPVFDCASFANGTSTSRGIDLKRDYCHLRGLTIMNAGYNGIAVGAGYNIIEGCTIHHCWMDGITLTNNAANTLVLNCDSYLNWDQKEGNNGDGFSAKRGSLAGNVFRGCRAWLNSDDGWDTYGSVSPVLIDSCWAFYNGRNVFGYTSTWQGNGNGFKLGAAGLENAENVMTNSVAFGNTSKGFDHNHSTCGQTIINCIGYDNANPNFSFYDVPTQGKLLKHIMRNNISYQGTVDLASNTENLTNSWDLNLMMNDNDFVSLDTSLATKARDNSYRIPSTGLFRLRSTHSGINKGTVQNNVPLRGAIPYAGVAPDLGAFEFTNILTSTYIHENSEVLLHCLPNPYSSEATLEFVAKSDDQVSLIIYNSTGQLIKLLYDGPTKGGDKRQFSIGDKMNPGLYFCTLNTIKGTVMMQVIKQ